MTTRNILHFEDGEPPKDTRWQIATGRFPTQEWELALHWNEKLNGWTWSDEIGHPWSYFRDGYFPMTQVTKSPFWR